MSAKHLLVELLFGAAGIFALAVIVIEVRRNWDKIADALTGQDTPRR